MSPSTTTQTTNKHHHHGDGAARPSSGVDLMNAIQVVGSLANIFSEVTVEGFW